MKNIAFSLLIFITVLSVSVFFYGLIRYEHLILEETDSLSIVERSESSEDSKRDGLWLPKYALPLKSVLNTEEYTVEITTPLNPSPIALLKIYDQAGEPLDIEGEYIENVHPSVAVLGEYQYTFLISEADMKNLEFRVIDKKGLRYPIQSLEYNIVSRGYTWAVDSL